MKIDVAKKDLWELRELIRYGIYNKENCKNPSGIQNVGRKVYKSIVRAQIKAFGHDWMADKTYFPTPKVTEICAACGKPKMHHKHILYGNDLDNPVKHEFETFKVPPLCFNPKDVPLFYKVSYLWWSWHPNYPYWSWFNKQYKNIEDAMKDLKNPRNKLEFYHNKLVRHEGKSFCVVEDVPSSRLDLWWDIKKKEKKRNEKII